MYRSGAHRRQLRSSTAEMVEGDRPTGVSAEKELGHIPGTATDRVMAVRAANVGAFTANHHS